MISTIRLDLLDLMGSGYVVDHCISALSLNAENLKYQLYITDCLKNINEIMAKRYGGSYVSVRYSELIGNNKQDKDEEKTGDEIAIDIMMRAGLKSRQEGGGENGHSDGTDGEACT